MEEIVLVSKFYGSWQFVYSVQFYNI